MAAGCQDPSLAAAQEKGVKAVKMAVFRRDAKSQG